MSNKVEMKTAMYKYMFIVFAFSNGTFSRGIECAEKIIESCDDEPEQRENLKKYLNIPRMKQGVDRVCTITVRGV